MSLNRLIILVTLVLVLGACTTEPRFNRYQVPTGQTQPGQSAVEELQGKARQALEQQAYQQAIDYLQRAIKIEPRNPWSWHYLADINWRQGELERCRSMLQRSQSYAVNDPQLDDANAMMRAQCQ